MKCKVVLCGEDKTQNLSCIGDLILSEKCFTLSYIFDGNCCLLAYDGKILRHEKKGEIPVCIEFVANKKSLCKIGEGGFCGEIPVFTKDLKVQFGAKKISVAVGYELGGEEKLMQIYAESLN